MESGKFKLSKQVFIKSSMQAENIATFEKPVFGVIHSDFEVAAGLLDEVRKKLEPHLESDGAQFKIPIRVDLLKKIKRKIIH